MKAHSHLEGTSNCTKCHDPGNKVTNKKCLECHKEIKTLISQSRGYHSDNSVKSKTCVSCHNDHHGVTFDAIRFDPKKFDHSKAGYKLEGKHASVECRECHKSANISDAKIKKRSNTYLGLSKKCLSCHKDYHQTTLGENCLSCHTMDDFKKAPKFDHKNAKFQLTGAHTTVSCVSCHAKTTKNNQPFQNFKGIKHAKCLDCHKDHHQGKFGTDCTKCHTNTSWKSIKTSGGFDHSKTNFPLMGKHASVSCNKCHKNGDFTQKLKFANCVDCHKDHHEGKMKLPEESVTDCKRCHNNLSWKSLSISGDFDHSKTDFPLLGQHSTVSCDKCHTGGDFKKQLQFTNCTDCHKDYHEGELKLPNEQQTDCKRCHSVEKKFSYSSYSLEDHDKGKFPLKGAHVATPCINCHKPTADARWTFKFKSQNCVDCHKDIHQDKIPTKYYPAQNCQSCHSVSSWSEITFDHTKTSHELVGKHKTVSCRACHFKTENGSVNQKFTGLPNDCASCHEHNHGEQFSVNGVTDCKKCHGSQIDWKSTTFDHSKTNFPLTGGHEKVACSECHKREKDAKGKTVIIYKLKSYKCIDCHY